MKLRVKYYKDMGKWIGEVQDDDTMKWLMKTYGCNSTDALYSRSVKGKF